MPRERRHMIPVLEGIGMRLGGGEGPAPPEGLGAGRRG